MDCEKQLKPRKTAHNSNNRHMVEIRGHPVFTARPTSVTFIQEAPGVCGGRGLYILARVQGVVWS
jgi:hypothetical protein